MEYETNEFNVFRWRDLITFGGVATIITVLIIAAAFTMQDQPWSAWRIFGAIACPTVCWLIYALVLLSRWRESKRVKFTTIHGLRVITNGYQVTKDEVENEVTRVLYIWDDVLIQDLGVPEKIRELRRCMRGLTLIFRSFPFRLESKPGSYAGYYDLGSNLILVGFRHPLETTALAHELGHAFLHAIGLAWTEPEFRRFAEQYDVPFHLPSEAIQQRR